MDSMRGDLVIDRWLKCFVRIVLCKVQNILTTMQSDSCLFAIAAIQ
jgi:hypothetical protein